MGMTQGIQPVNNYAGAANNAARMDLLLALIGNPNVGETQTAKGLANHAGSILDEISPGAQAQLYVEITACKAALT